MPRLFFALWPNSEVRAQLAARRDPVVRAYAGRSMRADTLHMTMLFLGETPELLVPDLLACGDRVRASSFTLNVDACCHFPHSKVAWLGCTEPPAQLNTLWSALREQVDPLMPAAFADSVPNEFHPHITVARDCLHFPAPHGVPPVTWPVEDFVLIDSNVLPGGPLYRVLRHWQLQA